MSTVELARTVGTDEYCHKINELVQAMNHVEGQPADQVANMSAGKDGGTYFLHTGINPLSMYDKELWQKAFPYLFPYGDGVFGLVRETQMTEQHWAEMMLAHGARVSSGARGIREGW